MDHLLNKFRDQSRAMSDSFGAEECRVATTADSTDDDVYVTLPNSDDPSGRLEVIWRVGISFPGGVATPRYPQRGDKGFVIYSDTGEAWLIW